MATQNEINTPLLRWEPEPYALCVAEPATVFVLLHSFPDYTTKDHLCLRCFMLVEDLIGTRVEAVSLQEYNATVEHPSREAVGSEENPQWRKRPPRYR